MQRSKRVLPALILVISVALATLRAADPPKPKVRAITGFVTIDAKSYPSQIEETVRFLSQVRESIRAAGYDVAGIRISTQPFPEYTRGLTRASALEVLRGIDDLAGKLQFAPNIGPAMMKDTDETVGVDLLIEVLAAPGNRLNANIVIAGDDGVVRDGIRRYRDMGIDELITADLTLGSTVAEKKKGMDRLAAIAAEFRDGSDSQRRRA